MGRTGGEKFWARTWPKLPTRPIHAEETKREGSRDVPVQSPQYFQFKQAIGTKETKTSGTKIVRRSRQAESSAFHEKTRSKKTGSRRGRLLVLAPLRRAEDSKQKRRSRVL